MKLFQTSRPNRQRLSALLLGAVCLLFVNTASVQAKRPDEAAKIVNWNFKWSVDSDAEAKELAQWDVLIIDIESGLYSHDRLVQIKKLNPDIKILAYFSFVDIRPDAGDALDAGTFRRQIGEWIDAHPTVVLRTSTGAKATWWGDYDILNITDRAPTVNGKRFNDLFPIWWQDRVLEDPVWDGMFFDNLWEGPSFVNSDLDLNNDGQPDTGVDAAWKASMTDMLKDMRARANKVRGKKFIITGNGGTAYYQHINGIALEHFPDDTVYGKWVDSMDQYQFIIQNALTPSYAILNTNAKNQDSGQTDYKKMRYGLMSALLGEGYYSYDRGDYTHHERWYYDEYDVDLGAAVSQAYNLLNAAHPTTVAAGLWRRDFERASVFVNSTDQTKKLIFRTRYEHFSGSQDAKTNSGDNASVITLKPKDGIMLLRRLKYITNITFINGAQTKVFSKRGKQKRNSFFSYDGSYPAQAQVHKISITAKSGDIKRTSVVADGAWVRVYNASGNQTTAFAPYGSTFSGDVNIAVGALYGGSKRYIVTGKSTGTAEVKIFNLSGRQLKSCIPYDAQFQGGVNVGVGHLGGGKGLHIVVSAGYGGGPHIRILNNQCKLTDPGFFAFSSSLRSGVNMAVGDVDGDGKAEIIAGQGLGGPPQIRVFHKIGKRWKQTGKTFYAYKKSDRSGVLVSTIDMDDDGKSEIVTSSFSLFNNLF